MSAECLRVVWLVLLALYVKLPVTVMLKLPDGAELETEILSPTLRVPPGGRITGVLVQLAAIPKAVDVPLFARFTVPPVLLKLFRVIEKFLFAPVRITWLAGSAVMLKLSSWTVIVNVSVIVLTAPELSVV